MLIERTQSSYELEQILLESERLPNPVELKRVVTDLDIFENIDKPYLTAEMVVADQTNLYETSGIISGEKITITLISSKDDIATPITKVFRVMNASIAYASDESQLVIFELIEECGFLSNLFNVNRNYSGKIGNILNKISKQYLEKEVDFENNELQRVNVIVPNLDPIQTMKWLRNRATTSEGFPFYLHSTLVGEKIFFRDLGTLLSESVINPDQPFRQDKASLDSPNVKIIINHKFSSFENVFTQISKGIVGASYRYIDTTEENNKTFSFDIKKDLYDVLISKGVMGEQDQPDFSPLYEVNGKSFNQTASRNLTMVGGSNARRNVTTDEYELGYSEAKTVAGYKQQIIAKAMDNVLKRASLNMVVPGINFIDGDKHLTIGNNIVVEFPKSTADRDRSISQIDTRRSGNYMIMSARHMFKKERYDISLGCVKLGNLKQND